MKVKLLKIVRKKVTLQESNGKYCCNVIEYEYHDFTKYNITEWTTKSDALRKRSELILEEARNFKKL